MPTAQVFPPQPVNTMKGGRRCRPSARLFGETEEPFEKRAELVQGRLLLRSVPATARKAWDRSYCSTTKTRSSSNRANYVRPLVQNAHMCLQCDGYSHEAAMQALDLQIKIHGWVVVQVGDDDLAFSYTIGLVENFGHPELIVLDVARRHQQGLINELAEGIAANGRPALDRPSTRGVCCVEVHNNHLHGDHFGMWAARYGALPQPGQVLQVLLPDIAYCECHADAVRRLDRPDSTPPAQPHLNRAQRRRRPGSAA